MQMKLDQPPYAVYLSISINKHRNSHAKRTMYFKSCATVAADRSIHWLNAFKSRELVYFRSQVQNLFNKSFRLTFSFLLYSFHFYFYFFPLFIRWQHKHTAYERKHEWRKDIIKEKEREWTRGGRGGIEKKNARKNIY